MSVLQNISKWFIKKAWPIILNWVEGNLIEIIKWIVNNIVSFIQEREKSENRRYEENINKVKHEYENANNDDEKRVLKETIEMLTKMYEESKSENEILNKKIESYKEQALSGIKSGLEKVEVDDIFEVRNNNILPKENMPKLSNKILK